MQYFKSGLIFIPRNGSRYQQLSLSTFTVVSGCTKSTTLDCSSHGYQYSRCQVPGAKRVESVNVATKYSSSDCNYGSGFGVIGANIWVHNGCRAKFNVCYKAVSIFNSVKLETYCVSTPTHILNPFSCFIFSLQYHISVFSFGIFFHERCNAPVI